MSLRHHRIDGREVVSLHDARQGRVATLGLREATLLLMADGTRDLAGIVAAARRAGRGVSEEHLAAFLEQLATAGMLAEGPSLPPAGAGDEGVKGGELVAFPDFRLQCDGAGTCCRLYPTVTFAPDEEHRARATLPSVDGFMPESGSETVPWRGAAGPSVDGRCAYLDRSRRCRLHATAGAEAKPLGCRRFPWRLVDDGETLRAAVAPECACVFRSLAADPAGEAAPYAPARDGQDPRDHVHVVGETVQMTAGREEPQAAYRRWAATLQTRLDEGAERGGDAAACLEEAAEDLDGAGDVMDGLWDEVRESLRRRVALSAWRHPEDVGRRLPRWLVDVTPDRRPRPGDAREWLYARALGFGQAFALGGRPVADELRIAALAITLARALPAAIAADPPGDPTDPAWSEPLALVAAYGRAQGLW